jgi:Xaa-Pro aminopeptidase
MKTSTVRQKALRDYLKKSSADAIIIPSGDNHFGEYYQEYFACRKWVSGFTGSAGTLVVTNKNAALWTDSRYFVQAEKELADSGIVLMKMRVEGTPSIPEWLRAELGKGGIIAIDGQIVSKSEFESLSKALMPLVLKSVQDPFGEIWEERPLLRFNSVFSLDIHLSGETVKSKIERVKSAIAPCEKSLYFISTCDDIAWLYNLRGSDIPFNPLFASYAVVTKDKSYIFVNEGVVEYSLQKELMNHGVEIMNYNQIGQFLSSFDHNFSIIAPTDKISVYLYNQAISGGARFIADESKGGITGALKAVKNSAEQNGFREAMKRDAVAWVKFIMFLESELEKASGNLTENLLAEKFTLLRAESPDYRGESFHPIVAFGANAALPHYSPSGDKPVSICKEGFLLVDTGAQYIYGTTDTTRTFALGELTDEQKRDYTLVLKGMINLSRAIFPKGTRGSSLDFLARGPVCSAGKLYSHGTGHGIGHYLCVHEGPQSIRMEENPVELKPGMVTSNEPAVYVPGSYGIRTENVILCKEYEANQYGTFYNFETLTLVPVDTRAIVVPLLGNEEVEWLNNYHRVVYNTISPLLEKDEAEWLKSRTACIG